MQRLKCGLVGVLLVASFGGLAMGQTPEQPEQPEQPADPEQGTGQVAEQEPEVPTLASALALIFDEKWAEAVAQLEVLTRAEPENGGAWYNLGYALQRAGEFDKAHDAHARAATFDKYRVSAGYNHACNHAVKNEFEDALLVLRNVIDAGFVDIVLLRTDPELAGLRGDPRFAAMVAEVSKIAASSPPKEPDWQRYSLESIPAEHRFDFTVGIWDLFSGEQEAVSVQRHVVERIFDGAGVQRDIFDAQGQLRAKSVFVYAPQVKAWKHIWIDSEGRTSVFQGGLVGTEMIMRQVTRNEAADTSVRMVYARQDTTGFESRVEQTRDDGVTWETTATTRYVKAKE